jgi:hypothetical protein
MDDAGQSGQTMRVKPTMATSTPIVMGSDRKSMRSDPVGAKLAVCLLVHSKPSRIAVGQCRVMVTRP